MIIEACAVEGCINLVNNCDSVLFSGTDLRICDEHAASPTIDLLQLDDDRLWVNAERA